MTDGPAAPPQARVELSRDGRRLGDLALEGMYLRWRSEDGTAGSVLPIDHNQLQALRAALDGLR